MGQPKATRIPRRSLWANALRINDMRRGNWAAERPLRATSEAKLRHPRGTIADCGPLIVGFVRDLFAEVSSHQQSAIAFDQTFRNTPFLCNAQRMANQNRTKDTAYSNDAFMGASQLAGGPLSEEASASSRDAETRELVLVGLESGITNRPRLRCSAGR